MRHAISRSTALGMGGFGVDHLAASAPRPKPNIHVILVDDGVLLNCRGHLVANCATIAEVPNIFTLLFSDNGVLG